MNIAVEIKYGAGLGFPIIVSKSVGLSEAVPINAVFILNEPVRLTNTSRA